MKAQRGSCLTIVNQMETSLGHGNLNSLQAPLEKKEHVCGPRIIVKQV